MQVTLVRHGAPAISAKVDPARWPLSASGRASTRRLRHRAPAGARLWVASEELKALQTLQCLAPAKHRILQDPRFNEVQRDEPFGGDVRSRRRAWVEGNLDARHQGWETPTEAAQRFDAAIRDHARSTDALVVGSHGMVITAWLVHRAHVRPGVEAGQFWEALAFPDFIDANLA